MAWPFASKSRLTSDLLVKSASPSARFAFKLFRQLAAEQEARNVFFSPASVMLCLALLQEGAAGLTRESMAADPHLATPSFNPVYISVSKDETNPGSSVLLELS